MTRKTPSAQSFIRAACDALVQGWGSIHQRSHHPDASRKGLEIGLITFAVQRLFQEARIAVKSRPGNGVNFYWAEKSGFRELLGITGADRVWSSTPDKILNYGYYLDGGTGFVEWDQVSWSPDDTNMGSSFAVYDYYKDDRKGVSPEGDISP